jgi:hypothetical protein
LKDAIKARVTSLPLRGVSQLPVSRITGLVGSSTYMSGNRVKSGPTCRAKDVVEVAHGVPSADYCIWSSMSEKAAFTFRAFLISAQLT